MIDRLRILQELDALLKRGGISRLYVSVPTPLPHAGMEEVTCHSFPVFQIVLSGVLPLHIATLNGNVEYVEIQAGEAYFSLRRAWNSRTYETQRRMLMVRFPDQGPEYAISHWKGKGSHYDGWEAWYEAPPPLFAPTAHTLVALQSLDSIELTAIQLEGLGASLGTALLQSSRLKLVTRNPLGSTQQGRWRRIVAYLDEMWNQPVQREDVARTFSISPDHVTRLFRQYAGETFSRYINRLRIEHAQHLLASGELSVKEIAGRCGFQDSSYFVKVFKRHTGHTPGRGRH